MFRLFVTTAAAVALTAAMAPAPASGITYDKLAYLTFTAPVQIPGVTLGAGTYRFHLANPDTSRNVVQVISNDGSIVYAMFHTIPDRRLSVTEDPMVTFREVPEGVAPPVKTLFYGGEHRGYEFVYPKGGPNTIADIFPQPEITYTPIPAPPAAEPVIEPEIGAVAPEPVPEPAVEETVEPEAAPVELPRTATPLPLFAIGGVASLVVGLGLGLLRRRVG